MEDKKIYTLDFANQNLPLPYESRNSSENTFVTWGLNNLYPAFLVDMYSNSAIHSAIINQKTNYIIGNGLKYKDSTELDFNVNPSDSINEFVSKITKDYLLFNAFIVEVNFNVFGEPVEFFHIPFHKVRMNKSKNRFWYNENWLLYRSYVQYNRYSPTSKNDATSKLYLFDGYFPSINNTYPTPEYHGTLTAIATDIAIKDFNLNNIKNHFSPSTIITFFNGSNVDEKVKQQIVNEIETKFKGENGKKFIIDFQGKDDKSAEVKQLSANDWDKAYIQISENNMNDILIGHQVQNPQLFAIQTPGKLGNSQELEVSYEIFKANYISVKRNELVIALNNLFINYKKISGKVEFSDKPLFAQQLKDDTKLQVFTINELRNIAGLQPLPDGDRLLSSTVVPKQDITQTEKKKSSVKQLSEYDFDKIKHLGSSFEDFDIIEKIEHQHHKFDKESDIAKYVIDNDIKGLTISELVDVLDNEGGINTTENELQNTLNKLNDSGVIKVVTDSNNRIQITPNKTPDIPNGNGVVVMYQYQKRPEIDGEDLIPTSRSFCVKMITNKRLYSREDIQQMSAIFGYDIYAYCGGFYYNPETETTTPTCRHIWTPLKVSKKIK